MATAMTDKSRKVRSGIPCNEQGLLEFEQTWKDMEDCFEKLRKSK